MPMQITTLPIIRTVDEAPHVRTFLFDPKGAIEWRPGAHIHVGLPGFNADGKRHPELVRHMSICTTPEEGLLGFTTRLTSSDSTFKRTLAGLGKGDELSFFKCGSVLHLPEDGSRTVLLSQGVGIATMRPLILEYARRAGAGDLRTPSLVSLNADPAEQGIYEREFASLSAEGLAVERVAHRGDVERRVRDLPDIPNTTFEVVGSEAFLTWAIALLRGLKVADERILIDRNEAKRAPFFA